MSDRKYRQRGYQDDDGPGERAPRPDASRPRRDREPRGHPPLEPRKPNMPGFHEVTRCTRCGHVVNAYIAEASHCAKCGADLHACAQCVSFDSGSRFECLQPVAARVTPKDKRNACSLFEPRITVERITTAPAPSSARKAFDDLFK
jgi:hypothetical protein